MIESFRQEVAAALDMVKEVREVAGERMVAPLPPGRAEGESGGREWPAAGRGEAGSQSERGTVTSAQQGLGGRRLEIPPGRPAADGRRHYGQHTEETVHIYKSAPSTKVSILCGHVFSLALRGRIDFLRLSRVL